MRLRFTLCGVVLAMASLLLALASLLIKGGGLSLFVRWLPLFLLGVVASLVFEVVASLRF